MRSWSDAQCKITEVFVRLAIVPQLSLMKDDGSTKDDLKMPTLDDDLIDSIRKAFDDGKDLLLTVQVRRPTHARLGRVDNLVWERSIDA